MVESSGTTVVATVDDEKTRALTNYRKKLVEYRDIEQQLKLLRKKVSLMTAVILLLTCMNVKFSFHAILFKEAEMQKSFDKSENDIKSLQSVGQIVGEVLKQLTEEKFIVKVYISPLCLSVLFRQYSPTLRPLFFQNPISLTIFSL